MKTINTVIFDMDGTIFDTERLFFEQSNIVSKERGLRLFTQEEYAKMMGATASAGPDEVTLSNFGGDIKKIEEYYGAVRERVEKILDEAMPIKDGVIDSLEYLRSKGILICLSSSTVTHRIMRNLERSNLTNYFDYILGGDQLTHGKPHPEAFLKVVEDINGCVDNAVVLEDSKNGMIAAIDSGCDAILVPDLFIPTDDFYPNKYVLLDSLAELPTHLENNYILEPYKK